MAFNFIRKSIRKSKVTVLTTIEINSMNYFETLI